MVLRPPCPVFALTATACVLLASQAAAQGVVPGSLVPGRQSEARRELPTPLVSTDPMPTLVPDQLPPEKAAAYSFVLQNVAIDGAQSLDAAMFDDLWKPLIGQTVTIARMFDIAAEISARYIAAGYALTTVTVPKQKIENGRVVLAVSEGFIDQIVFKGDPLWSVVEKTDEARPQGAALDNIAAKLLESRPLKSDDIDRYLTLMNNLPGVKAVATFEPSKVTPSASVMRIDVTRRRVVVEGMIDNRGSKTSRRWSIGSAVTLNGLLYGADSLKVEAHCGLLGCGDSYDYFINWSTLLNAEGLRLSATFDRNGSRPLTGDMVPLEFYGEGTGGGVSLDYPVLRGRQKTVILGGGFDSRDSRTKTFSGTLTNDVVRVFNLHGSLDFIDDWRGINSWHMKLSKGYPIFGATEFGDPTKSRAFGSSHFSVLDTQLSHLQTLAFLTPALDGFSLFLYGEGQAALGKSLLSASQCSYGGQNVGRGYDAGAIAGDHCLAGLAELRRDVVAFGLPLQGYIFGDVGKAWIKGPLVDGEAESSSAGSTGLGLRVGVSEHVISDFQVALPLRTSLSEDNNGAPRLFLSVKASY